MTVITSSRYRLAYLVSHPIQYQAPLLRALSKQPDIDLTVFFQSDFSLRDYRDPGFGRSIQWDVPLLDGYHYEVLPAIARQDTVSPLSYGLAKRLRQGRFDFLWVHGYARWFNIEAMIAARMASIAVLVRDESNSISATRSNAKALLKKILFFGALRTLCDGFLAIGSLNRRYYLENGVDSHRVFSMPYCVDNAYFSDRANDAAARREALREQLRLQPGRPIILYAAKFERRKRPDDLLKAFQVLAGKVSPERRPYLIFIGDGLMRTELEATGQPSGDDVRFLGFRNQSELPSFFNLCDVFVLPSEREPWGLAINEVMSAGRAVVVSDQVGCGPDLVKNGVNGYIFPLGNIDALALSLKKVLKSPEISTSMGRSSAEIMKSWSFDQDIAGLRHAMEEIARLRRNNRRVR